MKQRIKLITSENRPKVLIVPQFLTCHNTANTAPAINERNNIQNNVNPDPDKRVSFHWAVDDKEAILCIPENEKALHAGRKANMISIGMEICEPADGLGVNSPLWPKIYNNAVELAADITKRHKKTAAWLRTHAFWTGKECPRLLLPTWEKFVGDVTKRLEGEALQTLEVKIKVDNKIIHEKRELPLIDGRVYVPLREFAELTGNKVDYADKTINIITKK